MFFTGASLSLRLRSGCRDDEIMPTSLTILKTENNEIWVHGRYDEANQKYWIYRYKIELSKP